MIFICMYTLYVVQINQDSAGKDDRLKQLEVIVFKQNDRLALLEKQNGKREDENRLLNAELSNHRNEVDKKINDLLLQVSIQSELSFEPASADSSRLKRPARLLPLSILK